MNDSTDRIYDLLGVGVGPFNLGLCSLLQPLDGIDSLFFEAKPHFHWHAGMLIGDATLQVPFMADLVTMVEPRSRFTYLNYLHEHGRLHQFYSYQSFYVPRVEYNHYCQWVSEQLDNIRFSARVVALEIVDGLFCLTVADQVTQERKLYRGRDLVVGVGTEPVWPKMANDFMQQENCIHSSGYVQNKRGLQAQKNITLVGSGQSAAEIFLDLLKDQPQFGYELNWLSRSRGFISMEYSKLGSEHFTPDYVEHFHALPEHSRLSAIQGQSHWYKGISIDTIREIYDCLYIQSIERPLPVVLQSRTELEHIAAAGSSLSLSFRQLDMQKKFTFDTHALILATGYDYVFPPFLSSLGQWLEFDGKGHAAVNRDYTLKTSANIKGRIYVQNAEIHSHGVGAPDLGMGAYRSASIINNVTNRVHYPVREKNAFQTFGIAPKWEQPGDALSNPLHIAASLA
ncbi:MULTISPECIES: lysine N(6)-hydroxylase/L-ornithine N(5)-oxygenase family protein [Pseudomonas syringae group]|nr:MULTISPECIES: SidA/IucD/PvdA family monooxygenase [Pseudomonas syringae group]AZG84944.1 siderophore biosynthesis protein [Pseudomonas syringae pv. pisi str. PP1]EKG29705.1 siderophore biosynthesis protein [Pseudomonas avellanae BPIC 631]PYD09326.1 siderophore biosynthesis protein [Pseudomonas syringae pv. pisi]PYD26995.1 siderophore biosynthesis protein [Pseudomonas syringae pv. pisi]PYD27495.1 siderophore biosynthesis protein [Pseudomonas syringae pv. pisi]